MIRGWRSKKPARSPKKSETVMSRAAVPFRFVIRISVLAIWTTWSGPTATVEFAGSALVSAWLPAASPANPETWLSGAVVWLASTGLGAARGRLRSAPGAGTLRTPDAGPLGAGPVFGARSVRRAAVGPVA